MIDDAACLNIEKGEDVVVYVGVFAERGTGKLRGEVRILCRDETIACRTVEAFGTASLPYRFERAAPRRDLRPLFSGNFSLEELGPDIETCEALGRPKLGTPAQEKESFERVLRGLLEKLK